MLPAPGPLPEIPLRISGTDLSVEPALGCLRRDDGAEVHLRPKTFHILMYLLRHRDRVVPKEELVSAVWKDTAVTDDAVIHCVLELRRLLGDEAKNPASSGRCRGSATGSSARYRVAKRTSWNGTRRSLMSRTGRWRAGRSLRDGNGRPPP